MPYVNVQVTRDGVTTDQKQRIIQGITAVLVGVLNKDPKTTHIVIQEIDSDNWGYDNNQVTEIRKHEKSTR
jgi:4-oxalocrotonate tautomerase